TKGEDQGGHEVQIFADLRLQFDTKRAVSARSFIADEKADRERQHDVINKCSPHYEEDGRGRNKREERAPLVAIESRCYEKPKLRRDNGKRQTEAGEHTDFYVGEKCLVQSRINKMPIGLTCQGTRERRRQECVDVFR